jgi:hypothetical protein
MALRHETEIVSNELRIILVADPFRVIAIVIVVVVM